MSQTMLGRPEMPIVIGVFRIGRGRDGLLGDGFQQAHADHRRGNSWRKHNLGMERAGYKLPDLVARRPQAVGFAVVELTGFFPVEDYHPSFRENKQHRPVL